MTVRGRARRRSAPINSSRLIQGAIIHAILLLFVFIALFPIYLMFNAALKNFRRSCFRVF